jgi:hypothetical protein
VSEVRIGPGGETADAHPWQVHQPPLDHAKVRVIPKDGPPVEREFKKEFTGCTDVVE